MVVRTGRRTETAKPKTKHIILTQDVQETNKQVLESYNKIVELAKSLLTNFEMTKYRTYAFADYTKDPNNVGAFYEFCCHLWNVSIGTSKEGKNYINIYYDATYLEKFGSNLTNQLMRGAYKLTQFDGVGADIEYSLKVAFVDYDVHSFFFKSIVGGETDIISIGTVEHIKK